MNPIWLRYEKVQNYVMSTYNDVFLVKDHATDQNVVLKKIRVENIRDGIPFTFLREITILRQLRHPNIVELKDVIIQDGSVCMYLAFEPMDMDLYHYIQSSTGSLAPEQIRSFTTQILRGLEYCHVRSILHR
jgi:serine/threonine protein kinase